MKTVVVQFRCTLEEREKITRMAGPMGLSKWIRSMLLEEVTPIYDDTPEVSLAAPAETAKQDTPLDATAPAAHSSTGKIDLKAILPDTPRAPRSDKTCKHGTSRGHHCWQCGGLAQTKLEAEA